jgi:hypothetical protein
MPAFCPSDATPPAAVGATIQISGSGAKFRVKRFVPDNDGVSPRYIDSNGNFYFNCFNSSVKVTLTIYNSGSVGFYEWPVTFSDDGTESGKITVPQGGHHQFPNGITKNSKTIISFVYHNDNDGGSHDHVRRFPSSQYGLHFAHTATGQYLGTKDPTINNGGND